MASPGIKMVRQAGKNGGPRFVNKKSPDAGRAENKGLSRFVNSYIEDNKKVEPMFNEEHPLHDYLAEIMSWSSVENADVIGSKDVDSVFDLLPKKLKYNGVGFDLQKTSLTQKEQHEHARDVQAAYERGATVRKMVFSFSNDYLREMGIIDEELEEPIKYGDLRGQTDQRALRVAIQDGMQAFFDKTTMHQPQMIAGIHTNTNHAHVHIVTWDQDEKVKDDRGYVNKTMEKAFVDACDTTLKLNKSKLIQPNLSADLMNLMVVSQKNAQNRKAILERQLPEVSMEFSDSSFGNYVSKLSDYGNKELPSDKQTEFKRNVMLDVAKTGVETKRKRHISLGERRAKRQDKAMVQSNLVRKELNAFMQADQQGQVSDSARVVKDAMNFELEHQLKVVEKYRQYQRNRVHTIYDRHKEQLDLRRESLLDERNELVHSIAETSPGAIKPFRDGYITRLLDREAIMGGFSVPVTKDEKYQDLLKAESDPFHILKASTIQSVVDSVPDSQKQSMERELKRTQTINESALSVLDRQRLLQHLEEVDDYVLDSVYWGGSSAKNLSKGRLSDSTSLVFLDIPETDSIYSRPSLLNDKELASVDAHEIISDVRPSIEVELAFGKELLNRNELLTKAMKYFDDTKQAIPRWLSDADKDLKKQFELFNQFDTLEEPEPDYEPTPKEPEVDDGVGILLTPTQSKELVEKHLNDVDEISR